MSKATQWSLKYQKPPLGKWTNKCRERKSFSNSKGWQKTARVASCAVHDVHLARQTWPPLWRSMFCNLICETQILADINWKQKETPDKMHYRERYNFSCLFPPGTASYHIDLANNLHCFFWLHSAHYWSKIHHPEGTIKKRTTLRCCQMFCNSWKREWHEGLTKVDWKTLHEHVFLNYFLK